MRTRVIRTTPAALIVVVSVIGFVFVTPAGWTEVKPSLQATAWPSYLLRLERVRPDLDVCVLVRGDGHYHYERHTPDKVRVFEGDLDAEELPQLIRLASVDDLFHLTQDQISDPMLKADFDEVVIAILRPRYLWQQLTFADSNTREPYRDSLDPLLDWLNKLQKLKSAELSEFAARNNCLVQRTKELGLKTRSEPSVPPESAATKTAQGGIPQLSARPPQASPGDGAKGAASLAGTVQDPASIAAAGSVPGAVSPDKVDAKNQRRLLLLHAFSFGWKSHEASCIVISRSGPYHSVAQTQENGSNKVRSQVLDGVLDETQLAELEKFLRAPELRTSPVAPPPALGWTFAKNAIQTSVSFRADGTLYNFTGWRSRPANARRFDEAMQEHGLRELAPMEAWLKTTIDMAKAAPVANPLNASCAREP